MARILPVLNVVKTWSCSARASQGPARQATNKSSIWLGLVESQIDYFIMFQWDRLVLFGDADDASEEFPSFSFLIPSSSGELGTDDFELNLIDRTGRFSFTVTWRPGGSII